MFESGPGGDFSTYIGKRSGNYYRLNLAKINYLHQKIADLLQPAIDKEGALQKLPDELLCKNCGAMFSPNSIHVDSEETIDAVEL